MPRPVSIAGRDLHCHQFVRQRHHSHCGAFRRRGGSALRVLRMSPDDVRRIYCGVRDGMGPPPPHRERQKPAGFISRYTTPFPHAENATSRKVGAIGAMNHGAGAIAPANRGCRTSRKRYPELQGTRRKVSASQARFRSHRGKGPWKEYWKAHAHLVEEMRFYDEIASRIRKTINDVFDSAEL